MKPFNSIFILFFILFSSCAMAQEFQELDIKHAEVRATAPGQDVAAIYLDIENHGNKDVVLIGAMTDVAKMAQLHSTTMHNHIASMAEQGNMIIPAHGHLILEAGDKHIMLMGLHHQLNPGELVQLTLKFKDHKEIHMSIPVKAIHLNEGAHHHMDNMKME